MSKKLKSSILCVLTTLLAFTLAILFGSNISTSNVANASGVSIPTTYTTAAKTDFYLMEGAQINVDATGIRFVVKITKGYYDDLTNNGNNQVEFYGVVNGAKADASKAQIKAFSTPTFAENALDTDTYSMNITIKYDSYIGNNELAYMTELVADAYAKKADGSWIKAYTPENNQRSMRVVANAAYISQIELEEAGVQENADYKAKLSNYFNVATRTDDEMAYVLENGQGKMILPALSNDTYIGAYIGSKNVATSIDSNVITLEGVDLTNKEVGDLQNITALTKNGNLYTMKLAYATGVLTASNIGTTLLGGASGYYVLGEDINMGTSATDGVNTSATWGETTSTLAGDFTGTLNGLGYTLKNIATSSAVSGLFETVTDTRFINFNITGKVRAASGILAAYAFGDCVIDNVYAKIDCPDHDVVGLIREAKKSSVINVLNTVVEYTKDSTNKDLGYFVSRNNGTVNLGDNLYGVAGAKLAVGTANSSGTTTGTIVSYDSFDDFIVSYDTDKVSLDKVINSYVCLLYTPIKNDDSVNLLLSATSGYYLLKEDIVMTNKTWNPTTTFNGVLNGNSKSIINLTTKGSAGLFKTLGGTVRNLSFIDVAPEQAIIAYQPASGKNVIIENVFISSKNAFGEYTRGIFRQINDVKKLTIKDVVMKSPTVNRTNAGFIAGFSTNKPVELNNVYFIDGNSKAIGERSGYVNTSITGTPNFYTSSKFVEFYETGYSNLTTFLQGQCESVLGCAKGSASSN